MKKIAIIGSNGTIGKVLQEGLKGNYQLKLLDLPYFDARDYEQVYKELADQDIVINLAWNISEENFDTGSIHTDNSQMFFNIYKIAMETNVKRVIMASSVHADNYFVHRGHELMTPHKTAIPDSPYGATKNYMEALGRFCAMEGLEVICIRFGGMTVADKPDFSNPYDTIVWLSHKDCLDMIKKCIEAESVPYNFSLFYAVSDNKGRVHDNSNPFGWKPKDNYEELLKC